MAVGKSVYAETPPHKLISSPTWKHGIPSDPQVGIRLDDGLKEGIDDSLFLIL